MSVRSVPEVADNFIICVVPGMYQSILTCHNLLVVPFVFPLLVFLRLSLLFVFPGWGWGDLEWDGWNLAFFCFFVDQQATVRVLEPRDGCSTAEQSLAYSTMRADHGEGGSGRDELGSDFLPLHAGTLRVSLWCGTLLLLRDFPMACATRCLARCIHLLIGIILTWNMT